MQVDAKFQFVALFFTFRYAYYIYNISWLHFYLEVHDNSRRYFLLLVSPLLHTDVFFLLEPERDAG